MSTSAQDKLYKELMWEDIKCKLTLNFNNFSSLHIIFQTNTFEKGMNTFIPFAIG